MPTGAETPHGLHSKELKRLKKKCTFSQICRIHIIIFPQTSIWPKYGAVYSNSKDRVRTLSWVFLLEKVLTWKKCIVGKLTHRNLNKLSNLYGAKSLVLKCLLVQLSWRVTPPLECFWGSKPSAYMGQFWVHQEQNVGHPHTKRTLRILRIFSKLMARNDSWASGGILWDPGSHVPIIMHLWPRHSWIEKVAKSTKNYHAR